ncbi:hypothetical protein NMY22_g6126 [Coprinellus aureogranulatus]|nr:hypothetical protein NMY22_g6126 [Coprinellus aureogranulatus]
MNSRACWMPRYSSYVAFAKFPFISQQSFLLTVPAVVEEPRLSLASVVWIQRKYTCDITHDRPVITVQLSIVKHIVVPTYFKSAVLWFSTLPTDLQAAFPQSDRYYQRPTLLVSAQLGADQEAKQYHTQLAEARVGVTALSRLVLKQGSPVVDFAWFPSASKIDPATYCFAASVRECPVKLLDATTGKLRASYRIVDHRERQIAPHSLAFTFGGDRLFCGFEDAIEVFDVGQPGEGTRRHTTPSKKSKDGLKGIISAIAFSTYNSTADDVLFAAGSLTPVPGNIALYTDIKEEALMFLGGGPRAGVTQLQFNHYRPHILYAAYRGSANGTLYSWDIRSRVDFPLAIYDARPLGGQEGARNQKLRFDLDIGGRYIGTGNWAGEVALFDVAKTETDLGAGVGDELVLDMVDDPVEVQPTMRFQAHRDTVTSVSFQPWKAEMLTVSGSRRFNLGDGDESDDEGETTTLDNSITLWDLSPDILHAQE